MGYTALYPDFRFQKGVEVVEALGYTLARFQISDFRKESRLELHFRIARFQISDFKKEN